jgi:hypothetical protein
MHVRVVVLNPLSHVVNHSFGVRVLEHDFVMQIGSIKRRGEEDRTLGFGSLLVSQPKGTQHRTMTIADRRKAENLEQIRHSLRTESCSLTISGQGLNKPL